VQLSVSTEIAQFSFRGGCLRDSSKEGQTTLIPQLFLTFLLPDDGLKGDLL
jgi:hypothetical protein